MLGPFKKQEGMRIDELGRLFRKRALVVSRNQRAEVTELAHRVTHSGVEKTCAYLSDRFYWVGMRKNVEQCCRECIVCLENKRAIKKREPLKPIVLDNPEPRRAIAADIAVQLWGAEGYRYMLIVIDLFSKFVEIVAMRDQTAESVCSALLNGWIYRYGVPDMLLTDQGRNVDGEAVRKMCARFGINKKHSSAYHPQGDGQAERAVESVKQALRCFLVDQNLVKTSWPSVLQEVAFNVNSLMSSSTKLHLKN